MELTRETLLPLLVDDEEEDIEVDGAVDDPEETLVPETVDDDYDAEEAGGEEEGEPAKKKTVVEE